jgi:hypothetical protein
MAIVYVERRNGVISIISRKPGPGREAIDDTDPEVAELLHPPVPPPAERVVTVLAGSELLDAIVRELAVLAGPGVTYDDMIARLEAHVTAHPNPPPGRGR